MNEKEQFVALLKATGRKGIDQVISNLEALGFFMAPASTKFHGNYACGLLTHSMNVLKEAKLIRESQIALRSELAAKLPMDSIVIAALLHDVCKAEIYKQVKKFRKDANGKWEEYVAYGVDHSDFPLGHGEKSVIRLLCWGLEMTEDEILAIRWHMSGFEIPPGGSGMSNYSAANEKSPLLSIIIAADILASQLLEK